MSDLGTVMKLPAVHEVDGQLSLAHLQLSMRTLNACGFGGFRTIADVTAGLASGKLSPGSMGRKTHDELRAALLEVCGLAGSDGRIDWDRVWSQRGVSTPGLAMTSGSLDRLAPDLRDMGLGTLHLRKACSGLERAGIRTIGALIDAARNGVGELSNFGKVAQEEVIEALQALSKTTDANGQVEWEDYALARGFALLPENAATSASAAELLTSLPLFCERVVIAQFNDRAWEIFKRRLLVPERNREKLEEIGVVYGVTRERIRQIEEACLNSLRKPLLQNDYRGLEFRLRGATVALFREAREHFKSLGLPAWTESRWLTELAALWQVGENELQRYDRLLVETLGYRWESLQINSLDPLIVDEATSKAEAEQLTKAVTAVHEALLTNCQGIDSFGLVRAFKERGVQAFGLEDVPMLVDLCSTAEAIAGNNPLFRIRFHFVPGRPNQAVRVLHEFGKPLHRRDLLREINRRLPEKKRLESIENLVNQLVSDKRLHSIGKSGNWALTEWGVEGRSLVDIIEDVLASVGEALHVDEITRRVLEKRPGSTSSIQMLMDFNENRFRRVARGIYGLTAWGDHVPAGVLGDELVGQFVQQFVESHTGGSVDFKELRRAFEIRTGLSARSAAGILAYHPGVEIRMENSYRRTITYLKDWRVKPIERVHERSAPLQSERIVEEAVKLLIASRAGELPLAEVVKHLEQQLRIRRPNLYAAIGQAREIEKVVIEGSAFKLIRLRDGKQPAFPQLCRFRTEAWRVECQRAITKLTVEEVDIGLFLLGRLFDEGMKLLLVAAREAGRPVSDGHLSKLQNRIDWAYTQGLFQDRSVLNLLRVERNERGHSSPPLAEREALLKVAPYLAGLYIDYLILIEQRRAAFEALRIAKKS
jgi:Sigma-70, region 4